MSSYIQNILQKAIGDGARNTKYDAVFQFTDMNQPDSGDVSASVKTTSFPSKSHNPMKLKLKGRPIPVRGSTKYSQQWDCTFYLTDNHKLKNSFELWIEALDEKNNYMLELNGLESLQKQHHEMQYYKNLTITQLNFDETSNMARYTLYNSFPISISTIPLSYEGKSNISEFTVTFSYTHFILEVLKGNEGNFIDGIMASIGDAKSYVSNTFSSYIKDSLGNSSNMLGELNNISTVNIVSEEMTTVIDSLNSGGLPTESAPSSITQN